MIWTELCLSFKYIITIAGNSKLVSCHFGIAPYQFRISLLVYLVSAVEVISEK